MRNGRWIMEDGHDAEQFQFLLLTLFPQFNRI